MKTLLDVDAFVERHGALPKENNRKPQDVEETRLAFWLRYQRRRAIAGDLCTYQQLSLDALDGFSWAPVDDAWDAHFEAYEQFLRRNGGRLGIGRPIRKNDGWQRGPRSSDTRRNADASKRPESTAST